MPVSDTPYVRLSELFRTSSTREELMRRKQENDAELDKMKNSKDEKERGTHAVLAECYRYYYRRLPSESDGGMIRAE